MLPSFLPSLLFGAPEPLERLVLDDERGILYSLAANNALQVGPAHNMTLSNYSEIWFQAEEAGLHVYMHTWHGG